MVVIHCGRRSESDSSWSNTGYSGHTSSKCLCQKCKQDIARFEGRTKTYPTKQIPTNSMLAKGKAESASSKVDDPKIKKSKRRESGTWSFRAYVCLKDGRNVSNLLDARRQHCSKKCSKKWTLLSLQHNWFHGHAQILMGSSPKIQMVSMSTAFCTHRPCKDCVTGEIHNRCLPWFGI
jgi:hypothetical protein